MWPNDHEWFCDCDECNNLWDEIEEEEYPETLSEDENDSMGYTLNPQEDADFGAAMGIDW